MPSKQHQSSGIATGAGNYGRDEIEAFNRRKEEDLKRSRESLGIQRRRRFHNRLDKSKQQHESDNDIDGSEDGEEGWRNAEGERLGDFGVDEDAEFYDEEDIPLGVLLRQRAQNH